MSRPNPMRMRNLMTMRIDKKPLRKQGLSACQKKYDFT